MREENTPNPSPKKGSVTTKRWFWPTIYASFSILLVGLVWGYSAYTNPDTNSATNLASKDGSNTSVEANANAESMKYPFQQDLKDEVAIVQEFYDVEADEKEREGALLVFNQTFTTSNGISLSVKGEPFEVLAVMSGNVEEVKVDPFIGNEIVIAHPNGMTTKYSSVDEIKVKKGDKVSQGDKLGKAIENDWNPTAGIHLHFEVMQEGVAINPKKLLAL
ncbi:M23 family metallopeptidase [Viridibacillus sp. YIM B01967]|uniref:M23 family metallopeptidase n=1 Tax=Viridibacillus soli TaxID=2798301 RepID=A0ABS1H875_9BACL|nr:M23 family metallopeptidase [Viridibacillus soli]MBK3495622.1 M23 family metallopeptidase [Viridibacillus soli]